MALNLGLMIIVCIIACSFVSKYVDMLMEKLPDEQFKISLYSISLLFIGFSSGVALMLVINLE